MDKLRIPLKGIHVKFIYIDSEFRKSVRHDVFQIQTNFQLSTNLLSNIP